MILTSTGKATIEYPPSIDIMFLTLRLMLAATSGLVPTVLGAEVDIYVRGGKRLGTI